MHLRWDVLIPAYNAAEHVEAAANSAMSQNHPPQRVVVCDDASTDGTAEVLRALPSVAVLKNSPNLGVGATRQRLLEAAESEWILFLDADDQLLPHASEVFAAAIRSNPNAAVHAFSEVEHGAESRPEAFTGALDSPSQVAHADLLTGNPICSSATLIRRDIVIAAGGFTSARRLIDYCLWLRIARTQPLPLFVYRTPVVSRFISADTITGNVSAAVIEEAHLLNREWNFSHSPSGRANLAKQVRLIELWLRGLSRHIDYGKPLAAYVLPSELKGYSAAFRFLGLLRTRGGARLYATARDGKAFLARSDSRGLKEQRRDPRN